MTIIFGYLFFNFDIVMAFMNIRLSIDNHLLALTIIGVMFHISVMTCVFLHKLYFRLILNSILN
jgi:hypothetical protein